MFIVIGSRALEMHGVDIGRKPRDLDLLGDRESVVKWMGSKYPGYEFTEETLLCPYGGKLHFFNKELDIHIELDCTDDVGHNKRLLEAIYYSGKFAHYSADDTYYAKPEWIRWFKESHKYKKDSPHFWKTRRDLELLRKYNLPKHSEALMKEREELTYTNKLPNLNQGSKTFFREEDGFYKYKHDDIHKAISVLPVPAYTLYMKNDSEVMCSKDKFFQQSETVRLLGVLEEAGVLCLERSLIPFNFEPHQDKAFMMALSKVCTSITGGWFREYAYDNVFKVLYLYDTIFRDVFVDKFKKALYNGDIANFKQE